MSVALYIVFTLLRYCSCADNEEANELTLIFKWTILDFRWLNEDQKSRFVREQNYIPRNCMIRDFKIYLNFAYLTLPRWKTGVPATLARISLGLDETPLSPKLEPYPSWSLQTIDECSALQSVHSVSIDTDNNLWALDNGQVEELQNTRVKCIPKLVIIDLKTNNVSERVAIPPDMRFNSSTFTSMAVDPEKQVAFIADSGVMASSGFLVYNQTTGMFRRFVCDLMSLEDEFSEFNYVIPKHIISQFVSLSLNTDRNKLYFSLFDMDELHYVKVSMFSRNIKDVSFYTRSLGKNGRNVKLISDSKGYMYFDILNRKSVVQWRESSWVFQYKPRVVLQSKLLRHWISSLDVDEDGRLWIISSRFKDYIDNKTNDQIENIRIFRMPVDRKENPRKPKAGFNVRYLALILFILVIGIIIVQLMKYN